MKGANYLLNAVEGDAEDNRDEDAEDELHSTARVDHLDPLSDCEKSDH